MGLTVSIDEGRAACAGSVDAFCRAAEGFSEHELLGASRCHGWTRLDVVVHLVTGWQEALQGMVSPVDGPPTVDAASYWPAFDEQYADHDPVQVLMSQRRRTAAYLRPESAREQLRDVAAALQRGTASLPDRPLTWQGHVFTAGDFLAAWAVENVVHHLDLLSDSPAPADGLGLARRTVEAIVGDPLPAGWSDERAVLVGTGREPVPDEHGHLRGRLPALG